MLELVSWLERRSEPRPDVEFGIVGAFRDAGMAQYARPLLKRALRRPDSYDRTKLIALIDGLWDGAALVDGVLERLTQGGESE